MSLSSTLAQAPNDRNIKAEYLTHLSHMLSQQGLPDPDNKLSGFQYVPEAMKLPLDEDGNPPTLLHARVEVQTIEDHHTIRKEYFIGKPG